MVNICCPPLVLLSSFTGLGSIWCVFMTTRRTNEDKDADGVTKQKKRKRVEFKDKKESKEGKENKEKKSVPQRTFSQAISDILTAEIPDSNLRSGSVVLAQSKRVDILERKAKKERKKAKLEKERIKQRQLLANKDHVTPDFSNAEFEHKLKKIATKGVVQLFNAIAKQQAEIENADVKNEEEVAKLSKTKFLELLKTKKK